MKENSTHKKMQKTAITFISTILFVTFFSVKLFPAEVGIQAGTPSANISNIENVTDEEMGWPHNFKMEYKYVPFRYYKFVINDKVYNFDKIKIFFEMADSRTQQLFHKAYASYKAASWLPRDYEPLAKPAVESFNAFILSNTSEASKLKTFFQKYYLEKKRNEAEERRLYESSKFKTTLFIDLKIVFTCDMGFGLRFGGLFPTGTDWKIGFFVDGMYRLKLINGLSSHYDRLNGYGFDLILAFKYKSLYFGFGSYLYISTNEKQISDNLSWKYIEIPKTQLGFTTVFGFMLDKKFNFFAGIEIRIPYKRLKEYNQLAPNNLIDTHGNVAINIELGIGF